MEPRTQLAGPAEIEAALAREAPLRLVLASERPKDARVAVLVERARAAGIPVHTASESSLRRLSKTDPPAELLGLVGPDPGATPEQALAARGIAWLLVGTAYPGNTGFAIRTAEVSGADAVLVDNDFDHEAKREATRAAMRADRFMPVYWLASAEALRLARAAGRAILALEDVGDAAPWEVDLTGPTLVVVGGERHGIPPDCPRRRRPGAAHPDARLHPLLQPPGRNGRRRHRTPPPARWRPRRHKPVAASRAKRGAQRAAGERSPPSAVDPPPALHSAREGAAAARSAARSEPQASGAPRAPQTRPRPCTRREKAGRTGTPV